MPTICSRERRVLRNLFGNGAYVEGWAEYIAQVMMDEGFLNNDPKFHLVMRKLRLRLLANTILDVRMQTMNMTDEEAMDLMLNQCFQTQAEADGKLRRAKLSSTQLPTYYVGKKDWLQLRKDYQAAMGAKFNLAEFHNKVLDQGPLPIMLLRGHHHAAVSARTSWRHKEGRCNTRLFSFLRSSGVFRSRIGSCMRHDVPPGRFSGFSSSSL